MSTEQRVQICCLLYKMEKDPVYAKRLGLENGSSYRGKRVIKEINTTPNIRSFCI